MHHPEKKKMEMAWTCLLNDQRHVSKNSVDPKAEEESGQTFNIMETKHGRTEGCWADLGHSGKESQRQRELKAAGLTWGTAATRAQDRGN